MQQKQTKNHEEDFFFCFSWTGNKLWPSESVVKHYDKLYQALNTTNAAEPGNQVHNRFYVSVSHHF